MDIAAILAVAGPTASLAVIILGQRWQARKDAREDADDRRQDKRASFELEHDLRVELARISTQMIGMRRGLFAVADLCRADSRIAVREGRLEAAAAYGHAAERIEAALTGTPPPVRS